MDNSSYFLTIHGHFYQPPRENPWIEAIERQISAYPYHNWNERVAAECYTPNAASRILGKQQRIADIVNNYERISFNFGATLLSWMQQKLPDTYQAIIEADKKSREQFSGHGNAIAQAYNHIILPLANTRDKITQIKWGVEDFKYRFNREPEAIWLPETAVNYPTVEVLIKNHIKFIILSPFQAQRVRSLKKSGKWDDVSSGNIDISQPYRCFLKDQRGKKNRDKFLDIFFYHAELSNSVAFDHLLKDATKFGDKIQNAYRPGQNQPQLVSVCTDGESYGHHEPFGEIGLSFLLFIEANRRNLTITNYAEYLEKHPPQQEVELKPGPNGEGTAWSCSHGVGRWYRDCGCSTGGSADWNQKWRWHLRNALDLLRDDLILIFENEGSNYFTDPWKARDDYIHIILDRSDKNVTAFFDKHAKNKLNNNQKSTALNLLEMQRNAMLMYTSCGWFFADISGLEVVQILRYAAKAVEISKKFTNFDVETKFLSELEKAKSNIKNQGTGEDVYNNFVKPAIVSSPQIVNHFAILSTLEGYEKINSVYHFNIKRHDYDKIIDPERSLVIGNIEIKLNITKESENYAFVLFYRPNEFYECAVKHNSQIDDYSKLKSDTIKIFEKKKIEFWQKAEELWGKKIYSASDILYEEREQIYKMILQDSMEKLRQNYKQIYDRNKNIIFELNKLDIPIPIEFKFPAELSLSLQLENEIKESIKTFNIDKALEIVNNAEQLNFHLNRERPQKFFQDLLEQKAKLLYDTMDNLLCDEILQIWELGSNLKLKINITKIQNYLFRILHEKLPSLIDDVIKQNVTNSKYYLMYSVLRLAYNLGIDISDLKEKLKPLEQRLSESPDFWP